jgi:hypothetical protein
MKRRFVAILGPLSIFFLLAAPAAADQLNSFTQMSPTDTNLIYTGTIGNVTSSPVVVSAGGNTLTFSDVGNSFEYDQADNNYLYTAFGAGTNILYASGFTSSAAPVTISFANAVTEFGFNAEEFNGGDYTISFTVYDGATDLGTFTSSGCDPAYAVSDCSSPAGGTLSFEGFQSLGGITSVTLSDTDGDNIGLGPILFGGTPLGTPEPSSLVMTGLGLLGLMFAMRKRVFGEYQPAN